MAAQETRYQSQTILHRTMNDIFEMAASCSIALPDDLENWSWVSFEKKSNPGEVVNRIAQIEGHYVSNAGRTIINYYDWNRGGRRSFDAGYFVAGSQDVIDYVDSIK